MNKNVIAFTITLLALTSGIGWFTTKVSQPSYTILILATLAVVTWLVYFFMIKTKSEDFIKNYLLTIVLKIIAGGVFIFVLIFLDSDGAEQNAILFMASYLLYTMLEVGFLFRKFNQS